MSTKKVAAKSSPAPSRLVRKTSAPSKPVTASPAISQPRKSASAKGNWVSDNYEATYYEDDGGHAFVIDNENHKANIEQRKKKKQTERQEALLQDCRKRLEKIPAYLLRRLCDEKNVEHIPDNTREDLIEKLYQQFLQELIQGEGQVDDLQSRNVDATQNEVEESAITKLQSTELDNLRTLNDGLGSLEEKSLGELQTLCEERNLAFASTDESQVLLTKLEAWCNGISVILKLIDFNVQSGPEAIAQSTEHQRRKRLDGEVLAQIFAGHPKTVGLKEIHKILDQPEPRAQDVALLTKIRDYYGFSESDDSRQSVSYLLNSKLFNVKSTLEDSESSMFFRFASWNLENLTSGVNGTVISKEFYDLILESIVATIFGNSINIFALRNVTDATIVDSIVQLLSDVKQRQQWRSSVIQTGSYQSAIIWQPGLLNVEAIEWTNIPEEEEKKDFSPNIQLSSIVAPLLSRLRISEGQIPEPLSIPLASQSNRGSSGVQVVRLTSGTTPYIIVNAQLPNNNFQKLFESLQQQDWFAGNPNIILTGNFGIEKFENSSDDYLQLLQTAKSNGFFDHGLLNIFQTNIDNNNPKVTEFILFKGNQSLYSPDTYRTVSKERFLQKPKFWGNNGNYISSSVPIIAGFYF